MNFNKASFVLAVIAAFGGADNAWTIAAKAETPNVQYAAARSCKTVSSCEEAVALWCGGYRRADGDNDGIPCENVCATLKQVNEIRAMIGC